MISKREQELLWSLDDISEYKLETYTDEEIIDNINLFLRFESFRETKRAADLLCKLDDAQLKGLGTIFNLPVCLRFEDALELMNRGLNISKSEFTEKYLFAFGYEKEYLVKYKHLLDFNTIISKKLWYVNKNKNITDNFMEVCYDELKEVTTRTLLDAIGVNLGEECPTWETGLLMDKLVSINNRQFKDIEIINALLDAVKSITYTNPDFYNKIFKYFDDNYILANVRHFNPIQLDCAGRLTEEMLQKMINDQGWIVYEYGMAHIQLQLSDDFLINNQDKIKNRWMLINQMNIVKAHRRTFEKLLTKEEIVKVYLHNKYLDDDDLEYLKDSLKDMDIGFIINYTKIDDNIPELVLRRLTELKEYENGKG